jgi:hypothetical protein
MLENRTMLLRVLAGRSRVLEVNTQMPPHPRSFGGGTEAGGDAVAFGSDAHNPAALALDFPDARCHGAGPRVPTRPHPARPLDAGP